MRLYLVRHGEAKPAGEDAERHLSDAGVRDAERVAAFLMPLGLRVGAVRTDDLMIVGHLPFLGMLAALLLAGDEDADLVAFQCGAIVCLEGSGRSRFRLRWLVTPELVP